MIDIKCLDNFNIDFIQIMKHIRKHRFYKQGQGIIFDDYAYKEYYDYYNSLYPNEMLLADRYLNAYYAKLRRVRKFIQGMILKDCLFLTLTFTDYFLERTTEKTRRTYVNRYLTQFNTYAVANIDYGDLNQREHYHCFIQLDRVEHTSWIYGNIDFDKFNKADSENGIKRLGSYITKLAQHSVKYSTNSRSLIYKRPKKEKNELHLLQN